MEVDAGLEACLVGEEIVRKLHDTGDSRSRTTDKLDNFVVCRSLGHRGVFFDGLKGPGEGVLTQTQVPRNGPGSGKLSKLISS